MDLRRLNFPLIMSARSLFTLSALGRLLARSLAHETATASRAGGGSSFCSSPDPSSCRVDNIISISNNPTPLISVEVVKSSTEAYSATGCSEVSDMSDQSLRRLLVVEHARPRPPRRAVQLLDIYTI
jgi:hypothetical protein